MDKNVICYLMYLHISLKITDYFYDNIIKAFLSKVGDKMLDFQILAFKITFNQIILRIISFCNY